MSGYDLHIGGEYDLAEEKEIREKARGLLFTYPPLLRGESITFRYNHARVFMIPKRTLKRKKEEAVKRSA